MESFLNYPTVKRSSYNSPIIYALHSQCGDVSNLTQFSNYNYLLSVYFFPLSFPSLLSRFISNSLNDCSFAIHCFSPVPAHLFLIIHADIINQSINQSLLSNGIEFATN